jgi:hypothetical protein
VPKIDHDKVAAEIEGMQQELRNLQNSLAELLEAMITEEKPGPREIKKLETLKKAALRDQSIPLTGNPKPTKSKRQRKNKPSSFSGEVTFEE